MGEGRMGIRRNDRLAAGIRRLQIQLGEFIPGSNRSAALPVTPERCFLIAQRRAVPDLNAEPHTAQCEVRAAIHPGGAIAASVPDDTPHLGVIGDVGIARAVLEAEQITRCAACRVGAAGALEALLRPAQYGCAPGDAGQITDGMERHLQIIGAGLHTEIAAAPLRLQAVSRECREIGEGGWPFRSQPEPAVKEGRTGPEGKCTFGGGKAICLACVGRRKIGIVIHAADQRTGSKGSGGGSPGLQQFLTSLSLVVVRSNEAKHRKFCAGVMIPA